MATRTSYAPGTPCWVDLGSPDLDGSARFYGEVLGWRREDLGPEAGGYSLFHLGEARVAGLGPLPSPDVPPSWTVYVQTTDLEATSAKVVEAGGTVVVPPMEVMEDGSMAVYLDPQGSPVSAWQPDQFAGAELVNDVGAFAWNELASVDLAASDAFYGTVFGWSRSPEGVYELDGTVICGAHQAGDGEPPFWSIWFTVADCDASVATATELGATVV
ncbi:hypothetical protein B7486_68275, partial [cyanobacterium TDX16]